MVLSTGFAFLLYGWTLAPGITWAHHGADGSELIAAAITNGVPHPPGYPLYIMLLQGWLALWDKMMPASDLGWRANLLSAVLAALSVGVTVLTIAGLLRERPYRWCWAMVAGVAWATSPLLWSQAIITEVYALHALLVALLGWALLTRPHQPWWLLPITALAVANHLTYLLLMPAAFYAYWSVDDDARWAHLRAALAAFGIGALLGALFYVRIPVVATAAPPAAINWGYADNLPDFLWLVSGSAYRSYLFGVPTDQLFQRVAGWANTIVFQLTPVGLAFAMLGLAHLDIHQPRLRTLGLLWVLPISLYSIVYYTRDSEIYLLALVWMMIVWLTMGLIASADWLHARMPAARREAMPPLATKLVLGGSVAALLLLAGFHWPATSLRTDSAAVEYLEAVGDVIEPGSIIVTMGDQKTFALWYGNWGNRELAQIAPDLVIVNDSLYQFAWYRRLLSQLYPHVPNVDQSVQALIAGNQGARAIFFSEQLPIVPEEQLLPTGPLWRYQEQ